jgi:hypothetical protein
MFSCLFTGYPQLGVLQVLGPYCECMKQRATRSSSSFDVPSVVNPLLASLRQALAAPAFSHPTRRACAHIQTPPIRFRLSQTVVSHAASATKMATVRTPWMLMNVSQQGTAESVCCPQIQGMN